MANEIQITHDTGLTLYAVVTNAAGEYYNGAAFEAFDGLDDWADYDIALTESPAGGGRYQGTFPAPAAGDYTVMVFERAGASPAVDDEIVASGRMVWDGAAEVPMAARMATLATNLDATVASRAAESGGNVAAIKAKTDCLPADPAAGSDVSALLTQNIDSTGGQAVTLARAIEAVLAVLAGKAAFDPQTGVETFHGRDGATAIVTNTLTGPGNRTGSTIA